MKRILLSLPVLAALLLFHTAPARAQQQTVYCNQSTASACNTTLNPGSGSQGDPAWLGFGKTNVNFSQLYGMFGNGTGLQTTGMASYSDVLGLWTGTKDSSHCPAGDGTMVLCSGGGGSGTVGSGTAGQLAGYASAGTSVAGQSLGGDCSIDSSFDITCTESDGVAIVTTTATQTLTNKTISGSSNTLTNLPAANLTGTASVNTTGTAANLSGTPALPNGTTATTQTTGDDTTKLATDAFVLANASSSGVSNAAAGGGIAITGTGSGPYTGDITISASYSVRPFASGSTDTILDTDCANGVNYTSSSAVAITLPQATSSFAACNVDVINNSAVTETVTPTTSTINGTSSLAVAAGTSVNITALSGNYIAAGTGVGGLTHTIASGTAPLNTAAIADGVCESVVTVAATGVLTTDTIDAGFNQNMTGVTGYDPSSASYLRIQTFPTAGDVNFLVCNKTGASVTPAAATINWAVRR